MFQRINQFIGIDSVAHTKQTLELMLEVVSVVDRADLKNMLVNELKRLYQQFKRLADLPNIDHNRLNQMMLQIQEIMTTLNQCERKLAESLRQNEFLSSIRLHRANPGGISFFDVPQYYYWLNLSYDTRREYLDYWLQDLEVIQTTVKFLLQIIRESAVPVTKTASQGLFQTTLDPKIPCHLIRVNLPLEAQAFPEISVGRHRIYLRFFAINLQQRPEAITGDLSFKLTCCAL